MTHNASKHFPAALLILVLLSSPLFLDNWLATHAAVGDEKTQRVSVSSSGDQANGRSQSSLSFISANGRFVVFESEATNLVSGDTNGALDVFVYDRQSGVTERMSESSSGEQGNDHSIGPSISADGRFVAFFSFASNLVSGDTNSVADIFVRDRCLNGACSLPPTPTPGGETQLFLPLFSQQ